MKSFPMFIRTTDRRVVVAGGGEQAAQKTRLLLKTDGLIEVHAPDLDAELTALAADGKIKHVTGAITETSFRGAAMAFIATGCPGLDASLHAIAKDADVSVNVVDQPDLCDLTTPSIVDRDPVVVAIGTEGTAPVLARSIKTQMEKALSPSMGSFAALAGRLRPAVAGRVPQEGRRAFWAWAFKDKPWQAHKRGAEREAAKMLKDAIEVGSAPDTETMGSIALVGAGPGARDLLTLRAVERLQEADVIFYDRLVDPQVLELARRDAERVFVGKVVGAHAWPQDRINDVIVAAAKQGQRVVRLKSGDPMIFGRAAEEIEAAKAADVAIEVVPGVTAAIAASAMLQTPLTERGEADALTLCTGHTKDGAVNTDWVRNATPGAKLVIYMGMGEAANIAQHLINDGLPANLPVTIAVDVSKTDQQAFDTDLTRMAAAINDASVTGCGLIMLTVPKDHVSQRHVHDLRLTAER
ncbi:siroheme synthase CysG [Octadecabacter sp.]|nr:siroheme synthase CysG [Octadecabacter sp.]